jgi:type II secretory pathway pseudopilin PulG
MAIFQKPNKPQAAKRAAFTLIELLVVMFIMIIMATLAVLVAPRLRENQKITRGAEQVQGWLFVQKQRTFRDQLPRGLRLVIDPNSPPGQIWVRECIYIEQPQEYRGGVIQVPNPQFPLNRTDTAFIRRQTIPGQNPTPLDLTQGETVQVGDFLTFDVAPYTTYRINSVTPQANGTALTFAAQDGTATGPPAISQNPTGPTIQNEPGFHITRQARPMAGEAVLPLPKDVIIDLTQPSAQNPAGFSQLPGVSNPNFATGAGDNALDIIFNPRGGLTGMNSITGGVTAGNPVGGTIILWVRDATKTPPAGENALIAVYSRTGFIAVHPPDLASWGTPNVFRFVRDGSDSGM